MILDGSFVPEINAIAYTEVFLACPISEIQTVQAEGKEYKVKIPEDLTAGFGVIQAKNGLLTLVDHKS
jgi:hypothetical protein